jgi:hypothetical protein
MTIWLILFKFPYDKFKNAQVIERSVNGNKYKQLQTDDLEMSLDLSDKKRKPKSKSKKKHVDGLIYRNVNYTKGGSNADYVNIEEGDSDDDDDEEHIYQDLDGFSSGQVDENKFEEISTLFSTRVNPSHNNKSLMIPYTTRVTMMYCVHIGPV